MLIIGLTGGIGSGKSTVAALLAQRGATIVDADQLAREIVEPGQPALAEIAAEFGSDVIGADGALKRAALAQKAFATAEATEKLNAITHPRIHALTDERFAAAAEAGVDGVIYDMPLLIENNLTDRCDKVIVVTADEDTRIQRLVEYRGVDAADARLRMAAQLSDAERAKHADVVIDNSGDKAALEAAVSAAWDQLVPA